MLQVEILLPMRVSLPFNLAARHELYTDGQLPKLMMQVLLQLGHCDYFNAKRYPETCYFPRIPEFYRENFFAKKKQTLGMALSHKILVFVIPLSWHEHRCLKTNLVSFPNLYIHERDAGHVCIAFKK